MTDRAPQLEQVDINGVRIHAFTIESLHATIAHTIRHKQKAIVANVNVNAMNLAWEQPAFRRFLNRAEYVFCDGHGVMLAARLQGDRLPAKITYAHWLPHFAAFCADAGFSLFLLGGKPGIAEQAADNLRNANPQLRITGTQHGYFDQADPADSHRVIATINRARPDILLVAFGMPRQEYWLSEYWPELAAHIALTGGAALDYTAGTQQRPPRWMTDHGLEWLGRLLAEPGRLWKRYLLGNPLFYCRLLRYNWKRRHKPTHTSDHAH